ncbi:MAG: hypothetical protein U0936_10310 [Planctomycetaceae bacterium]
MLPPEAASHSMFNKSLNPVAGEDFPHGKSIAATGLTLSLAATTNLAATFGVFTSMDGPTDKAESRKVCVYCGKNGRLTNDHVPPQNLFLKPRPNDLITVPACETCNRGASKDDEYFRLMLAIRQDAGNTGPAQHLWPTIERSLKRSQAHGMTMSLLNATQLNDVETEAGVFLGAVPTYSVDSARLRSVVERITRGLYYNQFGKPLPYRDEVRVYSDDDLRADPNLKRLLADLITKTTCSPNHKVGDGAVFNYWCKRVVGHETASSWVTCFFQCVFFVSFNLAPELRSAANKKMHRSSGPAARSE